MPVRSTSECLGQAFRAAALEHKSTLAVIGDGYRLTYDQLLTNATRVAAALHRDRLMPGDRALVVFRNDPRFLEAYLGCALAAVVPVLCHSAYGSKTLTNVALKTGVKAVLCDASVETLEPVLRTVEDLRLIGPRVKFGGEPEFPFTDVTRWTFSAPPLSPVETHADDTMVILCSSGSSTGAPKLIARSHSGFLTASRRFGQLWGCRSTVRFGLISLITHAAALGWGVHPVLLAGGTMVIPRDRRPGSVLRVFEEHAVEVTFLVPSQAWAICKEAARSRSTVKTSLRQIILGGEVLDGGLALDLHRRFEAQIQNTYGMSEGFCTSTAIDGLSEILEGSVGRPCFSQDEIRIVDSQGEMVRDGEVGTLWVRGPACIKDYYGSPTEYQNSFSVDGFFDTGDVVRRLDGSKLAYVGRARLVINRAGVKVFPEEIEAALMKHPAIGLAVVVGAPDLARGEKICAGVQLKRGEGPVTLKTIREFLSSSGFGKWKQPDELTILQDMPLGLAGKQNRQAIAHQLGKSVTISISEVTTDG
jgi:non-ribosomal peptide synthetase component E (peptide arylation enzyme)